MPHPTRQAIVVTAIATSLGLLAGASFIGLMEFLPALVMPHGGWQQITREIWHKLAISTAVGGLLGLSFVLLILRVWRR